MEDAEPEDIPGDHWSRREATKPDVLVGLIGLYYGGVLRGQDRSLTEQEFDVAGQVGVDRLMFLSEDGDQAAIASQDARANEDGQRFRKKVNVTVFRQEVSDPKEFAAKAVQAVQRSRFRDSTPLCNNSRAE